MKVVHNADSPESALVSNDYPYGRTLRTTCRWWTEQAQKVPKKVSSELCSKQKSPLKSME